MALKGRLFNDVIMNQAKWLEALPVFGTIDFTQCFEKWRD
jgi:hypothetical protein